MTTLIRKAALTIAGATLTAGALAGPATVFADPASAATPTSAVSVTADRDNDRGNRDDDRRDERNDRRDERRDDRRDDRRDERRDERGDRGNGRSERELRVRYEAQPNFYYCGPAAARNALSTMDRNLSQDDLAKEMGTTENGTDSAHLITKALNAKTSSGTYRTIELPTPTADDKQTDQMRRDIVTAIDNGRAIVANIAGTATDTDGTPHSFEGGHYISVVGYRDNGDTVKIADSANPAQASYWITTEALADWTATRGYSA
ncbi:Peptidase_C39 like family protein [Micromonospora inyonensis]|uniref:Peptidase_C39 like family protein n=1 Tax=Micromonospora inyonensis TaxID=47866 RepID=A0A1C6SM93_9ACTN|nr:C39 family peptidase [Micromonospora inyonensis]SCL30455.1 Peptidase_C39 like family protein [Micromonospora inyonensis]